MTRAAWAERAINKLPMALGSDSVDAKAAIKLVEAEHRRAVRVVKRQLDLYQRQREVEAVFSRVLICSNRCNEGGSDGASSAAR
jgi:hypothetical protein